MFVFVSVFVFVLGLRNVSSYSAVLNDVYSSRSPVVAPVNPTTSGQPSSNSEFLSIVLIYFLVYIHLSVLSVLSVCPVCLSVCLSCLSVLSVCLSCLFGSDVLADTRLDR